MLQLGVIFMPVTLYHLCVIITKAQRASRLVPIIYLVHTAFAVSLIFNEFIVNVRPRNAIIGLVLAPVSSLALLLAFTTSPGLDHRICKQNLAAPRMRETNACRSAISRVVDICTNDMMPILGRDTYPVHAYQVLPLGSLAAVFYVVLRERPHRLLTFKSH